MMTPRSIRKIALAEQLAKNPVVRQEPKPRSWVGPFITVNVKEGHPYYWLVPKSVSIKSFHLWATESCTLQIEEVEDNGQVYTYKVGSKIQGIEIPLTLEEKVIKISCKGIAVCAVTAVLRG